jgi:hypothetical protein
MNHGRPINTPAVFSMRQLVDLADRITAVQYEMMMAVFRVGSVHKAPSPAAASNRNAVLGNPDAAQTVNRPNSVDPGKGQAAVSTESIRARAYEIYERRGHQLGDTQDDWYRAEAELRAVDRSATS